MSYVEMNSQSGVGAADGVHELLQSGRRLEFERRVEVLREGRWHERRWAAASLAEFGPQAAEPLYEALEDRNDRVKVAAVHSLAALGDPAAIGPLTEALKRNLVGRSGWKHALLSQAVPYIFLAIPILGFLLVYALPNSPVGRYLLALTVFPAFGLRLAVARMNHGRFYRAVMEALVQLAEPRAIPELCEVLPDIRSLAGDGNQDIHTRRALKQAAARIDRLVEEVRSLPIAAVAPPPSADVLPVVAHSPRGEPDHLPLPGADPGD